MPSRAAERLARPTNTFRSLNSKYHDPDYSRCNGRLQCEIAWGLRIVAGSDLFAYGSGFWVFFNGLWNQDCAANNGDCQESIINIEGIPHNLVLYNTNVKSVKDIFTVNGKPAAPRFHNPGSWGGVVAAYLHFSGKRTG